jgi:site-specific recombinase XerD
MSKFISAFATLIEEMLAYRESMGLSRQPYEDTLKKFDRFCSKNYPALETLTQEVVLAWLETELLPEHNGSKIKVNSIRAFSRHLISVGREAYMLPTNFVSTKTSFVPYILSDTELSAFFHATDSVKPTRARPFAHEVAPVLFRLIYTCGLRPNEGRLLKRSNINFDTGEILITHNKQKKERVVVMSDDMLALCNNYDKRWKVFAGDSEFFFPRIDGKAYGNQQFIRLFKKYWKKANPQVDTSSLPKVRPYDLRHRYASAILHQWLEEKRDLYAMLPYLRAYMGHEHFSSTAYYIHLLPERLVKSSGIDWDSFEGLIPEVSV